MADIKPRRAAVQRRFRVDEIDRQPGSVAAAGTPERVGRPKGLERYGRPRRPALVHTRQRIVHRIKLRSASQDAGNARQPGYVKAPLAQRQPRRKTLRPPDDKPDSVNIRALRISEPQPPAKLDRSPVLVVRDLAFQPHIGRAGEAVRYPILRLPRKEYRAEHGYGRYGCQEWARQGSESWHGDSDYRKSRTGVSASGGGSACEQGRIVADNLSFVKYGCAIGHSQIAMAMNLMD